MHARAFKAEAKSHGGENYVTEDSPDLFIGLVIVSLQEAAPGPHGRVAPSREINRFRYVPTDLDTPLSPGDYVTNEAATHRVHIGKLVSSPAATVRTHECEKHSIT